MINQQRLHVLYNHLNPTNSDSLLVQPQEQQLAANPTSASAASVAAKKPAKRFLKIKDSATGKEIDVPVEHDAIPASALAKFDVSLLDTGYTSVAVCKSKITYIDGDKGILRYRGYDIEDLAERASFLEVAFLLINGELPTKVCFFDRILFLKKNNEFFIVQVTNLKLACFYLQWIFLTVWTKLLE